MGNARSKIAPNNQHVKWVTTKRGIQLAVKYLEPVNKANFQSTDKSKAIFFIHGVAGCSDIWESQVTHFAARGYHVIATDLLGHGASSAPDDASLYRFEHMSADCVDVFDQMHLDVNIVIAHSYGTSLATYLAYNRSSSVHKLVLMSGGAPVPLAPQSSILSLPNICLFILKPLLIRFFHKNAFHKKSKILPNKERAFDVPVHVLRHIMKGQIWEEGDEDFHQWITQPTLLLHGDDDRLESFEGTMEMHKTLPTSEIYAIEDAGHMIMMEYPAIVNQYIEAFLNADIVKAAAEILSQPIMAQKISTSHSHMTKSQPNLRRTTITS